MGVGGREGRRESRQSPEDSTSMPTPMEADVALAMSHSRRPKIILKVDVVHLSGYRFVLPTGLLAFPRDNVLDEEASPNEDATSMFQV